MTLALMPADIARVIFYKRDELTTDLICCDIEALGQTWIFHEEMREWPGLIATLETLPGFRSDWFAAVSQPPFATNETLAYQRF
ncbi:hypothetical protein GCM10008023_14090 [Sphingomonas glacialis]|uniref:Uncharacterized protein n=2 Tax=Sphingomonas glacialis TaxID=658225 RepID=A0ABQ3LF60_9SPHN|nr:hypothetical protein GCM10008023_14090 [Sphingomonas glacialis]